MKQNARPATAAEITEIVGPLDDAVLVRTARDSSPRAQSRVCAAGNAEEMEDHGAVYETRTLKMREQIEAMKEISTKDEPEYHGEIVDFPPMMTWLKPVQTPHPPIIVGGTIQELSSHPTRRWRETDSNSRSLVCEIGEIRGEPGPFSFTDDGSSVLPFAVASLPKPAKPEPNRLK